MTIETPLDAAHAVMDRSDADRVRFYDRLAHSELFLLLEAEPEGDQISPRLFPIEDQTLVVAFDREERLAEFAGAAPYVALSGRTLAGMLAGQELGLGLNLDVAPSAIILPAEALAWLADMLSEAPQDITKQPEALFPPKGLPDAFITALDEKLAQATGLARAAFLSGVKYEGAQRSHLLAFIDPLPGAEPALVAAVNEALVFSGIDAGMLDVTFFKGSDPILTTLVDTGLRFDLPEPLQPAQPAPPGSDPSKPPRLK